MFQMDYTLSTCSTALVKLQQCHHPASGGHTALLCLKEVLVNIYQYGICQFTILMQKKSSVLLKLADVAILSELCIVTKRCNQYEPHYP